MKIMMTVRGDCIAPRFDLSSEVMIATCYDNTLLEEPQSLLISRVSAEALCELALKENVSIVICGGIEEQHYQFLSWKKIRVIDSVIGPHEAVLRLAMENKLEEGTILPPPSPLEQGMEMAS